MGTFRNVYLIVMNGNKQALFVVPFFFTGSFFEGVLPSSQAAVT